MRRIVALIVCGLAGVLAARTIELDYRAPARTGGLKLASAAADLASGTVRAYDVAARPADGGALAVGDVLSVALFDGVTFEIVLTARTESACAVSYLGAIDGTVCASVIPRAEGFFLDIQDVANNRVYKVQPGAAAVRVRECDPSLASKRDVSRPVPAAAGQTLSGAETGPAAVAPLGLSAATVIDILVVYDQGAAMWVARDGGGDVEVFAEQAVAKANAALANTELDRSFQFRVVACTNVPVTVTDLDTALDGVTGGAAGYEGIAALRAAAGADLVVHLIDTGSAYGTTGLGWSLRDAAQCKSGAFKAHALCACAVRSVAISHTMTHEIGHNMGAGHSDRQADAPGPQLYGYSSGYYFTGTDGKAYHTIMAYDDDGAGNHYTECPLFSSPGHTHAGTAAGTVLNDNTRTLAQTYAGTADYYPQTVPFTYGVTFAPESGAMFAGTLQVTITANQRGDAIYYTLDGTEPTAASTRYTGPITVTTDTVIKAISVDSLGNASRPFTARYSKSSLGNALNQPGLVWNTTAAAPWTAQTTNTHDGVSAAEIVGASSKLWTTVTGPTRMSFWYDLREAFGWLKVTLDDTRTLFAHTESVYHLGWTQAEVDIPAGTHKVTFDYYKSGYWNGAVSFAAVDEIEFDAYAQRPVIHPVRADGAASYDFTSSLEVSITAGDGQWIFYRTDGADPVGREEEAYTGPFTITRSTRVKAFATATGKKDSLPVETLFRERHPIQPGEWTTDVEGALESARTNGCALTLTLCANLATCWYCQQLDPVAESSEFLVWARANKIYLITMDASRHCDTDEAEDRFWTQYWDARGSSSAYYPTFTVADADDTTIGWFLARRGENCNGVTYEGTVASLIAVVSSYLKKTQTDHPYPVPYAWLDRYFGAAARTDADYQALADADSDGDGFSNWKECLCGTDPTDAADCFRASIRFVDGQPVVEWSHTNSAAAYQIQGSDGLPPVWGAPQTSSRVFRVLVTPK